MSTENRVTAWSGELARAHDVLRDRLSYLRAHLGEEGADPEELVGHCLAFCSALTTHHVGEDEGLFAELLRARPALEPVVANLVQDHQLIAGILTAVRRLAGEASGATAERRSAIGGELDGLAAIVESHFRYEERALADALDSGIPDTGWSRSVLADPRL